jgi:hypothetical protein
MIRHASSLHVSGTVWSVCCMSTTSVTSLKCFTSYHSSLAPFSMLIVPQPSLAVPYHCYSIISSSLYHNHHTSNLLPSITNVTPSLDYHYPSTSPLHHCHCYCTSTTTTTKLHHRTISSSVTQSLRYHFTIPTSLPHRYLSINAPQSTPLHLFFIMKPLPSLHHYTSTTNNTPSLGYYISPTTNSPSLHHYISSLSPWHYHYTKTTCLCSLHFMILMRLLMMGAIGPS